MIFIQSRAHHKGPAQLTLSERVHWRWIKWLLGKKCWLDLLQQHFYNTPDYIIVLFSFIFRVLRSLTRIKNILVALNSVCLHNIFQQGEKGFNY